MCDQISLLLSTHKVQQRSNNTWFDLSERSNLGSIHFFLGPTTWSNKVEQGPTKVEPPGPTRSNKVQQSVGPCGSTLVGPNFQVVMCFIFWFAAAFRVLKLFEL